MLFTPLDFRQFEAAVHGSSMSNLDKDLVYIQTRWEDITPEEAQRLTALFQTRLAELYNNPLVTSEHRRYRLDGTLPRFVSLIDITHNIVSHVFKLQDEWYYVCSTAINALHRSKSSYYRCDQWVGLVECLQQLTYI